MTVLIVIAIVATIGVFLWHYGRRPHTHRRVAQDSLSEFLEALLKRGIDGSHLRVEVPKSPIFLQFAKYVHTQGQQGLQLDLPLAPWSQPYYAEAVNIVDRSGLAFTREKASGGAVTEFLVVDFGTDVDAAVELGQRLLQSAFSCSADTTVNATLLGVTAQ